MSLRFDSLAEMDRLAATLSGRSPLALPIDVYRSGDHVVMHLDLPGVDPGSLDVSVERGVLTVAAERSPRVAEDVQWLAHERPTGRITRQLMLGDTLDTDSLTATYDAGVLTLTIAIAQRAKPRRIEVTVPGATVGGGQAELVAQPTETAAA